MKLEYVASGTSFMRLANPILVNDQKSVELVNNIFNHFFKTQPGHYFSLLYNAWAENNFGERLGNFKPSIHNLHADSGGLQMITLAHKLPKGVNMNDLKEEVYLNQAKWADVGMCFDEIPVITTGFSDRNDVSNRYFDRKNRNVYAKQTGENIKRQLEVFKNNNSSCKPFMICQGGDLDTYLDWINTVLDVIPKEDHKNIAGVAMGGAALGTGPLEDIQRAFFASQVPIRDENGKLHLHILGVGSLSRMVPYLIFLQNGLYGDVHISYDSTTHTRAVETGVYYMLGESKKGSFVSGSPKTLKYDRARSADSVVEGKPLQANPGSAYKIILEDIQKYYPLNVSLEKFHECLNNPCIPYYEMHNEISTWYECRTALCCSGIKNFMIAVENLMNNKQELIDLAKTKYPPKSVNELFKIKDVDSFNKWFATWSPIFKRNKKSKSISHIAPKEKPSLELFFQ